MEKIKKELDVRLDVRDFVTKTIFESKEEIFHKSKMTKKFYSGYMNKWRKVEGNYYELYQFAWKQKQRAFIVNGVNYIDYDLFNYGCNAMIAELKVYTKSIRLNFDSLDDDIMYDAMLYFDIRDEKINTIINDVMTFIKAEFKNEDFYEKLLNFLLQIGFRI
jgi:hypothetical protein